LAFAAYLFSLAAFLRFSVLFPRALSREAMLPGRRGEGSSGGLVIQVVQGVVRIFSWARLQVLSPGTVWGLAALLSLPVVLPNLMGMGRAPRDLAEMGAWALPLALALVGYTVALPLCVGVVGVMNLRRTYSRSDSPDRRRMLWIVTGFVAALWALLIPTGMALAGLLGFDLPALFDWLYLLVPLAPLILVLCLAVAIFFSGAVDPTLVIRKTTVYGALGVLFVFLFAGLGNLVEGWVESALGLPGAVGSIMTGGAIAVALLPLRGRFAGLVGRWAPEGRRDDSGEEG
jgi:hypothetical protein